MVKVSVIVPVYNTAVVLPRCLDSIVHQSYADWECILIDDGSTDGSTDIMLRYAAEDSRFKVLSQKNSGVSAARNRGMELACGEYVTFIDSDDYIDAVYLSRSVKLIESYDADMLVSGYSEHFGQGSKVETQQSQLPGWVETNEENVALLDRLSCARLLFDCSASYWGYIRNFFRLSLIRANGLVFDARLRYNEDRAFTMSYLAYEASDAVNLISNRPYYNYVIRGGSAMTDGFNPGHLAELSSFKQLCSIERKYFRDCHLNIAIRHAGLMRKHYLKWLAMNMERYDDGSAEHMDNMERDMLSVKDFLPPYTSYSRAMMKRWLQFHKYMLMKPFSK